MSRWARGAGRRVEKTSNLQCGVTGLTEELGGWGSLGDNGGLACRVAAAMECQSRLRHAVRFRVNPKSKQETS